MESLFVRSLALPASPEAHCLVSASRTTSDGTFAVASASEGVIRVYAASCAALLHEFASIHRRIYALHYTSFSDSLVTLESDARGNGSEHSDDDGDDDDAETFLCVYHDWRERKMVRGYTLPLGVLENPSSKRKADCVAVCSFTGRVVVAMGTVLNIWQCSRGFFEHVMELKVDMSQQHAYLQVEFVAIHGVYVAYASQTEVRVMEIHVRSAKEAESSASSSFKPLALQTSQLHHNHPFHRNDKDVHNESFSRGQAPDDETDCVNISSLDAMDAFVEVPIPCSSYGEMDTDQRDEKRIFDDQDHMPMVLGRNEAQQEAWNLAGLIKSQDIRVNQALSYFVGENDVQVLLQRFLPPNHCVQSLKFLPETIDNQVSVEARSYTRLLVATEKDAFLYYFLSQEADLTRKKMSKKVFGKGERTKSRGMHTPIKVRRKVVITGKSSSSSESFSSLSESDDDDDDEATAADADETSESGRVVMYYKFSSPVACIAANSSFLFVVTLSGLQVWSIWSPCHYVAASRALSKSLVPQPAQPQLLCTQPIPFPASHIAALDSYVVLLPKPISATGESKQDFIRLGSMAGADLLPEAEFELRRSRNCSSHSPPDKFKRSVMIFQQSPPSLIFSYMRNEILPNQDAIRPSQLDLLLSLFSLYRYRADVGLDLLHLHSSSTGGGTSSLSNNSITGDKSSSSNSIGDEKEKLALELETKLYNTIAKACAADLANIFTSVSHRNLSRAALLFVASNVPSSEVMQRFQAIMDDANRAEVIDATGKYLDAFVFPSSESLPSIGASQVAAYSTRQSNESNFTRTVLLHYGKYAPEQLSRLIVDSTLVWSLQDIEFGLEKLTESTSQSVLVKIATLVLILRASSSSFEAWEAFKAATRQEETGGSVDHFLAICSYESMATHVEHLLTDHLDALVHLSVTHPELLVQVAEPSSETGKHFRSSSFAHALLEQVPTVLMQILERVFTSAVRRQEAVFASLLFCLSVVGEAAEPSIQRLTFSRSASSTSAAITTTSATTTMPFVANQCFVLRFLVFVLEMFPMLEQLVEKEELHEDEDDLKRVKAAIGMEMMALCVKLSSFVSSLNRRSGRDHDDDGESRIQSTLLELFDKKGSAGARDEYGAELPEWVREYLETRCLLSKATPSERLRSRLRFLFTLTLELQQEEDLVSPAEILRVYEVTSVATAAAAKKRNKKTPSSSESSSSATTATKWKLENDFAALIMLLTLPRLSRYTLFRIDCHVAVC